MMCKYLLIIASCLFFGGGSMAALPDDDPYDPANPDEPSVTYFCKVKVSAEPAEGANVSGGGKYVVNGGEVYISTNARNDENYTYNFLYWTMNGQRTGYSQQFWFTPTKGTFEFVAHYEKVDTPFEPENPAEPSTSGVKRKYFLYLTPNIEGACSFNMASGNKIQEQSEFYVEAYVNAEYQFDAWKMNGEVVSTEPWLWFTMPSANTTLEACFSEIPFDPESPMDPNSQGGNIDNSTRKFINLTIGTSGTVVDRTRIVINEQKTLGYDIGVDAGKIVSNDAACQLYSLDDSNTKYSINERPEADGRIPLGMIAKAAGTLTISATRLDCTACLVDGLTGTWHDLALGDYTFNTEAGTFDDRFTIVLGAGDLLLGDVNCDGTVDVSDYIGVANYILGNSAGILSVEAANVDGNESIDVSDYIGVANIILTGSPYGKTNTDSQGAGQQEKDENEPQ